MKPKTYGLRLFGSALAFITVLSAGIWLAPSQTTAANSLSNLFVLGQLFGNDSNGILSTGSNVDLGNLFILDQLFNTGSSGSGLFGSTAKTAKVNLGDLIILNQIFGGGAGGAFGLAAQGGNSLGRLFVLDRLFAGGGTSAFGSTLFSSGASTAVKTTTVAKTTATSTTPASAVQTSSSSYHLNPFTGLLIKS